MKTLNQTVVSFVNSNIEATPTIQEYFNGMLEGLSSQELLVGSYYSSLTHAVRDCLTAYLSLFLRR